MTETFEASWLPNHPGLGENWGRLGEPRRQFLALRQYCFNPLRNADVRGGLTHPSFPSTLDLDGIQYSFYAAGDGNATGTRIQETVVGTLPTAPSNRHLHLSTTLQPPFPAEETR